MNLVDITRRLERALWPSDKHALPPWRARSLYALQVLYATLRDFAGGLPALRAMGLVYTTLLSVVPFLAFSFSVLKGFGVHNQLQPALMSIFSPLGTEAEPLTATIIGFVDRMNVGVLGAVGLAVLFYTVISLLRKIESAFNYTWRVAAFGSLAQRISQYVSVALIGPLLVFSALGITATIGGLDAVVWLQQLPLLAGIMQFIGRLVPYVLVIAAFTFIYMLVPNTRVHLVPALIGAVIAGILWETCGWLFSAFVASSTRNTVVYSSFAVLFLTLIWLYVNWLVLLFGATIAFYWQNPEHMAGGESETRLSCRVREKLGLLVMMNVARGYREGERWNRESLAARIGVSFETLSLVLSTLEGAQLLIRTAGGESTGWVPSRPADRISVYEIYQAIRSGEESLVLNPDVLAPGGQADAIAALTEQALQDALADTTLADVLTAEAASNDGERDAAAA